MPRIPGLLALRLTLLLGVLLCANTWIFVQLYRMHLIGTVAPKTAAVIAAELRSIRFNLRQLSADQRGQWLGEISRDGAISLAAVKPEDAVLHRDSSIVFLNILEDSLRRHVSDDVRVGVQNDNSEGVLLLDFNAADGRYRLAMPANGIRPKSIWPFAWLILSNTLIVAIGAVFATWQINRPLQKTAAALASSASQLAEIEMPESAPTEFRVFADRFNALVRQLKAQEHERAMLLAGASHDLRAPLTRIRLNAEVMDGDAQGTGSRILSDADSMRHIIDQFMAYQRGSNPTLLAMVDLCLVVADTVERYRELGHDVRFDSEAKAMVLADPTAIERILGNLIDNALAYGKAPVEIGLASGLHTAVVEVRDHGPGIAESDIQRLMKPFERLDAARSLQGHCGLGLSIVDRLTRELGGRLSISTHPEGGLVVRMEFPIRQASM